MAVRSERVMPNKGPYIVEAVSALDGILQRMQEYYSKLTRVLPELSLVEKFNP